MRKKEKIKFQSIKKRISILVLLCVAVAALLIGGVSIQSSESVVRKNSGKLLALTCSNKTETMNALLTRIEQSVTTLSDYAAGHIGSLTQFKTDKEYVSQYSAQMEDMALNAAVNTEGAMTVYIRYNPEFTEPDSGVFYSRSTAGGEFEKLTPTDFSMYDPSDDAHVGWYYIPVSNGGPTWLAPYLNENINVRMISYVIPITIDGTNVGIVGMDIDFRVLEDIVNNTSVYKTGYAFLADAEGNAIVHPELEMNEPVEALAEEFQKEGSDGALFSYSYQGKHKKLVFNSLKNGMRLAITAPVSEINSEASWLILKIIIIVIGAVLLSLIISRRVVRGIVRPIKELKSAAGKIAAGELDVSISCHTEDEVGALADSFRQTVERLRIYISYIDEIALVLAQIADGDLAVHLKQEYQGEFARIKDAIQMIAGTLNRNMSQIKLAAIQVSGGAEQVSQGAQILSQGTEEQSISIGGLSELMDEMLEHAKENEERARTAGKLTGDAGARLTESGRHMRSMMTAMDEISTSADAIKEIIMTINDIAEQTDLLALNASIEAARAGEAGKGFSVVANQVTGLADKSVEAAAKIKELVTNAVKTIENGEKIAAETESFILETVDGAKEVAEIVESIVDASGKQAEVAVQIRQNVQEISAVIEQTQAASQEGAASSEELSAQAQMLEELVSKFRLDESGVPEQH